MAAVLRDNAAEAASRVRFSALFAEGPAPWHKLLEDRRPSPGLAALRASLFSVRDPQVMERLKQHTEPPPVPAATPSESEEQNPHW